MVGLTSTAEKQRLEATVRRAIRLCLYTADDLTPSQLAADMDDLFANILNNLCHVLYKLLPNSTEHTYNLRPRRHSLSLTVKTNCNNFINRLLFKDIYQLPYIVMLAFCQLCYSRNDDDDDDDDHDEVG